MNSALISEVMSKSVASATPETPITAVIELMRQRSYSCLVITHQDLPVGIITERDILKLANLLLAGTDGSALQAQAIMTRPATTIRDSASLTEAIALCKYKTIRHLPVVDANGKLSGILTQTDLMNGFIKAIELHSLDVHSMNPWDLTQSTSNKTEDEGDSITDVNLNEVEKDLKNIFESMHASKNPQGVCRLQSRFI